MALTRAKLEELIAAGEIEVGGGGANPNILHNWDFRNPVNQRGLSTASGAGYWLDRWYLKRTTGATYTYSSSWGLRAITTTNAIEMLQYIENPNAYAGKTVTLSIDIYSADVTASCAMRLWHNGTNQIGGYLNINNGDTGIKSITATIPNTGLTDLSVAFYNYGGNDARIKSVKLELGTVSTLHLDPPMDHAVELPKCQRFYRLWKTDAARTSSLLEVNLMRTAAPTTGTIVIGGVTFYYASSNL